jgi:hypothetical protein
MQTLNFQTTLHIVIAEQENIIANYREVRDRLADEDSPYLDATQLGWLTNASHRAYGAQTFLNTVRVYNNGTETLPVLLEAVMSSLISEHAHPLTIQTFHQAKGAFKA